VLTELDSEKLNLWGINYERIMKDIVPVTCSTC
jgi:hypothetical protein